MNPSGNDKHKDGTDKGCNHYRPELCRNNIKIKHKRHSRRDKEETEIGNQKVGHALHTLQFNPT